MGEISAAADEQSAGIAQVNEAVSQMDQVTQQNAALVEESAAAAESLKAAGQQLVAGGRGVQARRRRTGPPPASTPALDASAPRHCHDSADRSLARIGASFHSPLRPALATVIQAFWYR